MQEITENLRKQNITVSLHEKNNIYQAVINYKDDNNKRKQKWVSTGIKAARGNKRLALQKAEEKPQIKYQKINLKMKLTDLALKTGNDIYAIYKVSEDDKAKIRELKAQKKKIDAVKLLKENYQMDLFEAKTYVDYL